MRTGILALIAVAVVAASVLTPAPRAVAQAAVSGVLSGTNALPPGGTGVFLLNATGGPAPEANGNFSISYYVTGSDLGGASPLKATPGTATSDARGKFHFNITAPQREQAVTLVVEINSTAGTRSEKATITHSVTIITPIVLRATFRNDGSSAAVNVSARFYVDGKFVGTVNIGRVEPGGRATASFSYLPVGLGPGGHTARVDADLNRNGVIEADKGEVVVLDVFYKKDFELTWPWAGLIIIVTVALSYLVIRARRRRR